MLTTMHVVSFYEVLPDVARYSLLHSRFLKLVPIGHATKCVRAHLPFSSKHTVSGSPDRSRQFSVAPPSHSVSLHSSPWSQKQRRVGRSAGGRVKVGWSGGRAVGRTGRYAGGRGQGRCVDDRAGRWKDGRADRWTWTNGGRNQSCMLLQPHTGYVWSATRRTCVIHRTRLYRRPSYAGLYSPTVRACCLRTTGRS